MTAGEQPQAEGSRRRSDSHDEAEAAKARRARSRPDSARRAERDALIPDIPRQPVLRTDFPSEFLLGTNLIDGVVG